MGRFYRKGITKLGFVAVIAAPATPTATELNARVDLTPQLSDIAGMSFANRPIDTPDLNSSFVTKIPGDDTTADPTLTFYDDNVTTPNVIRAALVKGTTGFLAYFPYGITAAKRLEIWPVTSTGDNDTITVGTDPARYVVTFAVTGVPSRIVNPTGIT